MKLEQLVPPLELCKQIPAGAFADSVLVWSRRTSKFAPHEWVIPRGYAAEVSDIAPAPTLAEILVALARLDMHPSMDWLDNVNEEICGRMCIKTCGVAFRANPATAALKLWLDLEGGK